MPNKVRRNIRNRSQLALDKDNERQKLARSRETPEQRELRLSKHRNYNKKHKLLFREQHKASYPERRERESEYKRKRYAARAEMTRSNPRGAHLYIMKRSDLEGHFKIGKTKDPEKRARELGQCHIFTMQILKIYEHKGKYEQQVHDTLGDYRTIKCVTGRGVVNGCEWYTITQESVMEIVQKTVDALDQCNSLDSSSTHLLSPSTLPSPPSEC